MRCPRCGQENPGEARFCLHCGAPLSLSCPSCGAADLAPIGHGTQRVEETLREAFPEARIARVDRDSTARKGAMKAVLDRVGAGDIDILVGTQMLAKGHDFQRVTLVGVISADSSLHLPDFRAAERTFQLLTQVAGRAGRGDLPGRVLIQSYYPEHYAIQDAVVAANLLTAPLRAGYVAESNLARVQSQREWTIRVIQRMQSIMQNNLLAKALNSPGPARVPWQIRLLVRIPILRDLPSRLIAFGPRRVRLLDP